MFKNLTNFAYQRNTREAFGFYIVYLVGVVVSVSLFLGIVGGIMGAMGSMSTYDQGFEMGRKYGGVAYVIISLYLSFAIIISKKVYKNIGYIIIALLGGFLALFLGAFGGLLPAAFLTTRADSGTQER